MLGLFKTFSQDIGIDLGTSHTLIYVREKGIVINEPTVVALNKKTGQILAVGKEAYEMLGRTPMHIEAVKPLTNGVISDFEVAEKMLHYYLNKLREQNILRNIFDWLRLIISTPCGGTEVEKRAVEDAAKNAGAKEVYLIEAPLATALGDHLPINESKGNLVVDIGGGVTEVAVISLNGIVISKSIRVAGNKLNEDIVYYFRDKLRLSIGDKTAEEIKIKIGSAIDLGTNQEMLVKGRDLAHGLPKEIKIKEGEIREAILPSLTKIINVIKDTIEITPPELIGDIMSQGVVISGGTSLLRGIDKLIKENISLPVKIAEDPLTTVIRGIGVVLEDFNTYKNLLTTISREKPPL